MPDNISMSEETREDFLGETQYWEVYLNPDQYYLGRCVVAAKREVGAMSDLTEDEWLDFAKLVKKMESGFKAVFGATMFNWACLMNGAYQDEHPKPHVHWHFRPRYEAPVEFSNMKFEDNEFGHHYARHTESPVPDKVFAEIVAAIRTLLK